MTPKNDKGQEMIEHFMADKSSVWVPDVKIEEDKPEYVYHPTCGFSISLIVLDDDKPIGWIDVRTLGFKSVLEWMAEKKYIFKGVKYGW